MHDHAHIPSPKVLAAVALVLAVLLASAVAGTRFWSSRDANGQAPQPTPATTATRSPSPRPVATEPPDIPAPDLDAEVARLRAASTPWAPQAVTRRISGEESRHPDLYAAEFTRRLLSQDYRTPRQDFLAWVQAESATTSEPLVVGLIPADLRSKWAVFSVSDAADGPAPVPSTVEWQRLATAGAFSTARVQRVTEPLTWVNAVEAGRITDPGLTSRVVTAEVTLHTRDRVEVFSTELSLEFEGPPVRDRWGFVGAVTYTSIQMDHR